MKKSPKNFSVKIIRGLPYVYSWSYRKKSHRSHTVLPRYHWKYRGRYGTKGLQNFMKQLDVEEQLQLKKEVQIKLNVFQETQKKINILLEQEPFKTRYTEVTKIKNRHTREKMLVELMRELKQEIKNN